MTTLHPERDVIASRRDGADYVYTVRKRGVEREVRIPVARLDALPKGPLGVSQRRAMLAAAVGAR